jgi:hypothetical protein
MPNRWTRMLGVATILCLMTGATVALAQELPPGGTFTDDDGNVHEGYIEALVAAGITDGCDVDRYCPDAVVTRGQMAAFLKRAKALPPASGNFFTDDDGSIFEADIQALAEAGITNGCNPPVLDRFCPDDPVTRGQMAAFLVRAFDPERALPPVEYDFVDDDDSEFEADIEQLARAKITRGCNPDDGGLPRFCPDDPVTRDQMASFLGRTIGLTQNVPPPPITTSTHYDTTTTFPS